MWARFHLEGKSAPFSSTQPSFGQMLTPGIRPTWGGFWCVIDHEAGASPAERCARFTKGHGWAKIFFATRV